MWFQLEEFDLGCKLTLPVVHPKELPCIQPRVTVTVGRRGTPGTGNPSDYVFRWNIIRGNIRTGELVRGCCRFPGGRLNSRGGETSLIFYFKVELEGLSDRGQGEPGERWASSNV